MAPEDNEQDRREIIWRLEQEEARADADLAKAQARKDEIAAKRLRAETAPDDPALCRECWVEFAESGVPMLRQPGGYGEDVYRCRNGHERRVQVR